MRRLLYRRLGAAVVVGVGLAVSPLGAATAGTDHPVVVAGFAYHAPVVVAQAGDTMSVSNVDPVPHNIVAVDVNPATGQPWFRSPLGTLYLGRDVNGVSSTPPGTYWFTCDLHPFMTGVLVIG